jgi:hypothetical protein
MKKKKKTVKWDFCNSSINFHQVIVAYFAIFIDLTMKRLNFICTDVLSYLYVIYMWPLFYYLWINLSVIFI